MFRVPGSTMILQVWEVEQGPPAERKLLLVAFVFSNSCGGNFGHSHGDICTASAMLFCRYICCHGCTSSEALTIRLLSLVATCTFQLSAIQLHWSTFLFL